MYHFQAESLNIMFLYRRCLVNVLIFREEEYGKAITGWEGNCPLYISDHGEDTGYLQWNQETSWMG
jgi:hypothetical protein